MARGKVRLDVRGVGEMLRSSPGIQEAVTKATESVAANVRAQGVTVGGFKGDSGEIPLPVTTTTSTTDRPKGRVTLAHPAGLAVQAKHGALTKAAGQAGLDVKGK